MRADRQLHVLFVDDDETIVSASTTMLENLGYAVSGHHESLKALRAFSEEPDDFDLAIVDHDMPDMTGLELGERLRRIRRGFPVMLYSGQLDSSTMETIGAAGLEHVIIEPVTVKRLERIVRAVL
jgi:two-component system, cell cycle sensor histidine kinase and response regulator CckA